MRFIFAGPSLSCFESPVIDWIAVDIQHIAFPFVDDRHRKPGFEAEARVIVPVGQYRAVSG